jgi:hypothetical protein
MLRPTPRMKKVGVVSARRHDLEVGREGGEVGDVRG